MAGQKSGTGAFTELNDERVRKEDILSNREKAMRRPGQSLDQSGVQVDEYEDIPTNQRREQDTSPEDTDKPAETETKTKKDAKGKT